MGVQAHWTTGYSDQCEDCIGRGEEPKFSWWPCELCGSPLGGDRYPAHYVDHHGDADHAEICTDCLFAIEEGEIE